MDDQELKAAQSRVATFTDPAVRDRASLDREPDGAEMEYAEGLKAVEVRRRLRARFEEAPDLTRIILVRDGRRVAVAPREKVLAAPATAGTPAAGLGESDRAGLPGRSTRYRLLVYGCTRPGCGERAHRSFHDERFPPECASGHGPMAFTGAVR
ncbi:hypothetical protein [Actinomadura madurae]|uniref:hypothetical protein n=1 Tax=Actinomadura madurae TaxID=1993 RepID=UPI000D9E5815|nr:hypothetical protein [Actinomadura madurae]SPT60875.1 Uncharacterised protein [Actinomadura madurae]